MIMKLGSNSAFSRVCRFPPAGGVRIETHHVLTVGLTASQTQRRVLLEDSPLAGSPLAEEPPLEIPKFRQALTAASCCAHACSEVRGGIFERALRISSGEVHRALDMGKGSAVSGGKARQKPRNSFTSNPLPQSPARRAC